VANITLGELKNTYCFVKMKLLFFRRILRMVKKWPPVRAAH